MSDGVGYNPSDPVQQSFLSALALGETGSSGSAALLTGTGGSNLTGYSTDQYGFPQWSGEGTSHAAGIFQFQPGTWDSFASKYGLNFANQSDQEAAAWYDAQAKYQTATGQSLETALQNGQFQSVQNALVNEWPSVSGNGAAPRGLAYDLANGIGVDLGGGGSVPGGTTASASGGSAGTGGSQSWIDVVKAYFARFGLIILGAIVIFIALWKLLSDAGYAPTAGEIVKTVGE